MKNILLVDDQEVIRELVEATLPSEDYQVFHATNAEEALQIVEKESIDLILMDIKMEGKMNGLEAACQLKKNPKYKNIKIIMLTGQRENAYQEKALQYGIDDYFLKPFSPLKLLQKIEDILE